MKCPLQDQYAEWNNFNIGKLSQLLLLRYNLGVKYG